VAEIRDFNNRLLKNWRHINKWAKRQQLHCFRLYDRDIPEFPLAIDWYQGDVHVQEYDTQWQQTEEEYQAWISMVSEAICNVLQILPTQLHFKVRRRQRGQSQYEKTGTTGCDKVIEEQGHQFWINLDAYLDSGLFLDHRNTRRRIETEAAGKRFLNLFCYTGAFTVYAAAGAADSSVSVDLSNTYLAWAKRNFILNGIDLKKHQLVRADVFAYLKAAKKAKAQFDLILLDPPSFSNSTKMQGILEIQRDHSRLIQHCLDLLTSEGVLYFSNNLRGFSLDPQWHAYAENMNSFSVPEDFRNKKIHQCWRIVPPEKI
jgi:23S rRNA (cytosine1962-C5)-methyltransferase